MTLPTVMLVDCGCRLRYRVDAVACYVCGAAALPFGEEEVQERREALKEERERLSREARRLQRKMRELEERERYYVRALANARFH